jgi:hypothetical protein
MEVRMVDRVRVDRKKVPGTFLCSRCRDNREFINAEGEVEACECLKFIQLYAYAPDYCKSWFLVSQEFRDKTEKFYAGLGKNFSCLFVRLTEDLSKDEIRALLFYWLLCQGEDAGKYVEFEDIQVYDLVDAYFRQSARFENLSSVYKVPALIIKFGWGVLHYAHVEEIINSVLGNLNFKNTRVLFLSGVGMQVYSSWVSSFSRDGFVSAEFGEGEKVGGGQTYGADAGPRLPDRVSGGGEGFSGNKKKKNYPR